MRSKIIFVVILMLSFVIVHDTVINILETNDNVSVTNYVSNDAGAQECTDINEIHSMFHFVGLVSSVGSNALSFKKEKTHSYYLLQYTPPHKENTNKPPIA